MKSSERMALTCTADPASGGRWTSLSGGGREWLWHRKEPLRDVAVPGGPFADAGGLEECIPTVRGVPDHGDAWSRPWRPAAGGAFQVDCDDFSLVRLITHQNGEVVVDYRMRAAAGYRFIWAAHALLDLTEGAELHAASGTPTRLFAEAEPYVDDWPTGAHSLWGSWPAPAGLRLDRCGRQDGTAVGAVLCPHETGEAEIEVGDGSDVLRLHLDAPGQPASMALWRNLGGFPATKPYRSIGVEPMLGRVFDLADAGEGEAAVVPAGGELRWRLTVTASRTASGEGSCL